jgi:hypothetical protein
MVTNYPQQLTRAIDMHHGDHNGETMDESLGLACQPVPLRPARSRSVLHFEGKRVNMRCTSCGHDTRVGKSAPRPRQRYEGDARRHVLVPQRLVLRKTA